MGDKFDAYLQSHPSSNFNRERTQTSKNGDRNIRNLHQFLRPSRRETTPSLVERIGRISLRRRIIHDIYSGRMEQFSRAIEACKTKHKTGGILIIVYHETKGLNTSTSSTIVHGTPEVVTAGTSTNSSMLDDLEEAILGRTTPDYITGPILQSISTFRPEGTYISTSEKKSSKYFVMMRIISNDRVKKLGRLREIFCNVPDQGAVRTRLMEFLQELEVQVQNVCHETRPNKYSRS
ncbi:hypothetical protein Trydic_g3607 [Trypoxylus dichotomus]